MKDYGQSVSFLHPFSIPFYRKFGWELYAEYKKYIIPVSKFPAKLESPGRVIRDVKDISILDTMYEAYASQYNGTLIRDESWWSQSVLRQNGFNAVYYSADGVPQGYVLYELKDSELVCREFVYLNEEARGALWTFFANHDSRIERVVLTMVPSDDELPFMLKDPRFTQEKVPYFMARIVDLKAFISQYTFEVNRQMELTIRVEDSAAPWNNGQWLLAINEAGGANIEKLADSEEGVSDLTTDIQTLSALFMGYKRPKALYRMQRILGDTAKVDQLESAVPDGQTHLMDFF
ncbi:acetyltransferase, GNAT family [Paenibacillus sp. JCM 10914]|nr:acetyltransferase, GNAT family [Paenibacillus sp. JCM 10914]